MPPGGRAQIDTPWTNGNIEAFWAILQAEVLDRQRLADLAAAEAAVQAYAGYYNLHRLHGELDWHPSAERFDGTPFSDRGLEHVPSWSERSANSNVAACRIGLASTVSDLPERT